MNMNNITKRDFLKASAAFGLGSAANVFSSFEALAQTAQTEDYRALVCVFMFGGNDSNNMLIPTDGAAYSRYATARSNLALPANSLLQIAPSNISAKFGLHPSMTGIANLFNGSATDAPKAALVANVGPLVVPTTKAQWEARSVPLPDNLFSHSDQQSQWQSAQYERPTNGWGGRLAERLIDDGTANRGYSVLSVTGGNLWETGDRSLSAYKVSASGNFGFDFYNPTGNDPLSMAITETMATPYSHLFEQGFVDVMGRSIEVQRILSSALQGTTLTTAFPNTGLGNQMRMVARLIAARQKLGLKKQCFFCSIGGFDTHGEDQLTRQAELLGNVSGAISAFYAATKELNIQNNVTTFTASDFNRTFTSNGAGSDHGWGGHHIVVGGGVQGGKLFGSFPDQTVRGIQDSGGQGNWIPTTSTEAYAATLGRWFGADDTTLKQVFPRLAEFNPNVGFLG
jgi:uncharacterized protein (DUF1501 family)